MSIASFVPRVAGGRRFAKSLRLLGERFQLRNELGLAHGRDDLDVVLDDRNKHNATAGYFLDDLINHKRSTPRDPNRVRNDLSHSINDCQLSFAWQEWNFEFAHAFQR